MKKMGTIDILSFLLAWMINELNRGARTVLSFLFYAPALSTNVYFIWQVLFSGDSYGYINSALLSLGIVSEPIQWFKDANYVMIIIIVVQLWMSMGISFLANISGLQNVNPEMYEAGCIDGIKNRWYELWYITLPGMKPMLLFGAIMTITGSFGVGYVMQTLCGFPSTDYAARTIVSHIQDYGFQRFEMGYASAIATILFLMMILCNKAIQSLLRRVGT